MKILMSVSLLVLAVSLSACNEALTVGPFGFSDQFAGSIGAPARTQPQLNIGSRYNNLEQEQMRQAQSGDVVLHRYPYRGIGDVEYVMTYLQKEGQEAYIVNAYILEYQRAKGREYVCSMNYDRYTPSIFGQMVEKKLEGMFPERQLAFPTMY